jgi:hypothetical protein
VELDAPVGYVVGMRCCDVFAGVWFKEFSLRYGIDLVKREFASLLFAYGG